MLDWEVKSEELSRKFGTKIRTSPVIYSYTGKFIGGVEDFEAHVRFIDYQTTSDALQTKRFYNFTSDINTSEIDGLVQENVRECLEQNRDRVDQLIKVVDQFERYQ